MLEMCESVDGAYYNDEVSVGSLRKQVNERSSYRITFFLGKILADDVYERSPLK